MDKPIIYFTNLTHITQSGMPVTETIPLNIGFLAAYTQKIFKNEIEFELFNLPEELSAAVKRKKPHILCASNYAWNANLSYHYLAYFKKAFPEIITVMGGPSFPYKEEAQKDFLAKKEYLDFYVSGEGELSFVELIRIALEENLDIAAIKDRNIKGCNYLCGNKLISVPGFERIQDLDTIPSPYLGGLLDKFLENGFTPFIQSNRGCPFSCAYCCSSVDYYSKVSFFSLERVKDEIEYIARRVKSPSIHIHDDNFGMFKNDYQICEKFKEVQERCGWPVFISAVTGKNNAEQILRCVKLLGSSILFSASVQSTNKNVLKNIKRENINTNNFFKIQEELKNSGVNSNSELILPLPGETRKSHLEGIKALMDMEVDSVVPYTTMLLPATPLFEEERFAKFKMIIKYRVIPRDFGKYEGSNIVETEKVCVGTKDLAINDYISLRGFHFIIYCYYNSETFKELFYFLRNAGVGAYELCYSLFANIKDAPRAVKNVFKLFLSDTEDELWDSEEDIYHYCRKEENFTQLIKHEKGANLLQKYHGIFYALYFEQFLRYAIREAEEILRKKKSFDPQALEAIFNYILNTRGNIFDTDCDSKVIEMPYNVHRWRIDRYARPLSEYKSLTRLRFYQTEKQKKLIQEYTRIYGNTKNEKGRILTRILPRILFKEVSIEGAPPLAGTALSIDG